MNPTEIQVGKTYKNRGLGRTQRRVVAIGVEHRPRLWPGDESKRPSANEPGVLYVQNGQQNCLFLSSFAQWAGSVA